MKKTETDIEHYLGLPYTFLLRRDEEGDIVARVKELDGCIAHGSTEAEALDALKAMQETWIADCLECGDPIPVPQHPESLPSGKWVQRVPRTLHKKLVDLAHDEGTSLNQLVLAMLSEAVAHRRTLKIYPTGKQRKAL